MFFWGKWHTDACTHTHKIPSSRAPVGAKKFLSQVFNIFLLYCIPTYSKNWFWNQNQAKFCENGNFIFFNAKKLAYFCRFWTFFLLYFNFKTFGIELMFPTDSQILVDDFRHQNFGIWTILSWVMAIFIKKWGNLFIYKAIQWFCTYFLHK